MTFYKASKIDRSSKIILRLKTDLPVKRHLKGRCSSPGPSVSVHVEVFQEHMV